jgi:hypothetical protein
MAARPGRFAADARLQALPAAGHPPERPAVHE